MIKIIDLLTLERTLFLPIVQSKKKALELIADTISINIHSLRSNDIFDGLISRERLGSTAIGHGVALPHSRLHQIIQPLGCFILLKEGVDFDAEDKLPVDILFSLIVPIDEINAHLEILAVIAKLFSHEIFCTRIRNASSREALYNELVHA